MKIGALYEYIADGFERPLFSDKQYKDYLKFQVSHCISTVLPNEMVVCLDKGIVEYYDDFFGDKGFETFMKVITNKGLVGWVVWRDFEWRLVENDPNKQK